MGVMKMHMIKIRLLFRHMYFKIYCILCVCCQVFFFFLHNSGDHFPSLLKKKYDDGIDLLIDTG